MKECTKCKVDKPLNEFSKEKSGKDGLRSNCKSCEKEYNKKYRQANRDKVLESKKKWRQENKEKAKEYRQANKEKTKEYHKEWYQANKEQQKEYGKEYRQANKERLKEYDKEYRQANKEKIKDYKKKHRERENEIRRNRYKSDPLFRLRLNIGTSVKRFIDGKKSKSTQEIIGCSWEFLYLRLNLDAHQDAHIDHIIPLSWARNEEELYTLNHWSNFQLLEAEENISKGNRYCQVDNVKEVLKNHPTPDAISEILNRAEKSNGIFTYINEDYERYN